MRRTLHHLAMPAICMLAEHQLAARLLADYP